MSKKRVYNPKTKQYEEIEINDIQNNNIKGNESINLYNPSTRSFEDIAPVEKNTNKWFKGGAFEEDSGLGFFEAPTDAVKTILGTAGDITTKAGSTLWNMGGDIAKLGAGYVAKKADDFANLDEKFGFYDEANKLKEFSQRTKNRIAGKDEETNKRLENLDIYNRANKLVDVNSVLGDKSDKIVESIAQIGGYAATSAVNPALGNAVMFGTSAGSSLGENYGKENITDIQAWTNALAKGGISLATERAFGLFGKSGLDTAVANKISSKLSSGFAKVLARAGVQATGEALEEAMEYIGDQLLDLGMDTVSQGKGAKFHEDWNLEELGAQMGNAFLSSLLVGAGQTALGVKNSDGSNLKEKVNEFARQQDVQEGVKSENEQKVIDLLVKEQIDEKKKNNEEYSEKGIKKQAEENLEKGYVDIDTIEQALGGKLYDQYQNILNQQEELQNKIETLENTKVTDMTYKQQEELKSLREQLENLNVDGYKQQLRDYVNNLTQNDPFIRNSYNEYANRGNAFQVDLDSIDEKLRPTFERAMQSGILNNTNRTYDFVNLIAKLESDKGIKFNFTNNENLKNTGFVLDGKVVNGYITDDGIFLNIDSDKALNNVVGHEITHAFEGSELYDALQESVKNYVESTGKNYEELRKTVQEKYSDKDGNLIEKNIDIDKELTADLIGDYLFTDEEFVRKLSVENRNLFQKIYDEIKYLSRLLTAGSKEGRQLEKAKHLFEKIYRESNVRLAEQQAQTTQENTQIEALKEENEKLQKQNEKEQNVKYSIESTKDGMKYVKDNQLKQNGELSQKDVFDILKGTEYTFEDGNKAYIVGWLKSNDKNVDKKSMYNELFKRYPSIFKNIDDVKDFNKLVNYNTDELLKTSNKVENNIKDINNKHQAWDIDSFDTRESILYDENNDKAYIIDFSIANLKNGKKIAYAKKMAQASSDILNKIKADNRVENTQLSASDNNISQKDRNVKYSISNVDNQGRKLSKQQREYFKDSKVVDDKGDLRVLYNGSGNHTEYLPGYMSDESIWGKGIYLTPYKNIAEMYGNDVKEAYVNIENPLTPGKSITFEQYNDLYKAINDGENAYREEYDMYDDDLDLLWDITNKGQWADYADEIKKYTGKDGIIVEGPDLEESDEMVIAFKSNQVKNVDNLNPTKNNDIRMSLSNQNEDIAPIGDYQVKGKDIKIQDIAPIETNQEVKETTKPKADLPIEPTKEEAYEKPTKGNNKEQRRKTIQQNRELAAEYLENMNNWKDTPLFKQKINTMKRNLRDIMPKSEADTLYNEYFAPISKNNATIEREIKQYNKKIENLNLNKNESIAVQLLGELKYNPETTLNSEEVYDFINKNKLNETKLENAINTFRDVYDDLFGRVNKVLEDNGYEPIGYRKGYFPHFTEEHGKNILGKLAEKLGWQFNSQKLPTDIAGLTDTFKPGKKWVAFSQHRTGDVTDYNALKGFDNYVRGAMQVIHHTEDIQKLRGLENEIRYQYSEKGIKEKLDKIFNNNDLNTEEKQNQVDALLQGYNSGLGNFVMNLREYTNNLAGKKSGIDRSVEYTMGRNIYNTMNNISSRVSANMVGLNFSSALTNFIPITQAWSQVSTKNMMNAMKQTIANQVRSDGFVENSDYLTSRIDKADKLYKSNLDKVSDKANVLFDAIDSFSSQVIVRGKYLDNIQAGMSEQEAINNANEFAKDVMAGRSQGDKPTIFNSTSPITKLFTAFQLEVNNQYGYMFKDIPNDLKNKGMSTLIAAFIKMFLGAWLYNKMAEELTGRKSAFSPIDIVADSVETMQREDLDEYSKLSSIAKDISDESPFVSGLLGGGRLPINAAIPDIATLTENTINLKDEEKKDVAIKNIQKEFEKPLFYAILPFGGGQLKKTKDALSMYDEDLPIAGSYTPSGNLRFTADDTPSGKIKAALFGQYSSKEAQEYVDSGYKTISSKKIQELKDLGMSASEYRKYSQDLKNAGTTNADKIDFIANSNYTDKQKNIMGSNVLNKDFNVKEYKKYGSYEEADYAINNPEKYLISKVTTNNFDNYKKYLKEIGDIKADKDQNGKSISNSRKNKVINYINNLNEDIGSKMILYKMQYPSDNSYNNEIVEYLNNKNNITLSQEKKILQYLGMTITDEGTVRW